MTAWETHPALAVHCQATPGLTEMPPGYIVLVNRFTEGEVREPATFSDEFRGSPDRCLQTEGESE